MDRDLVRQLFEKLISLKSVNGKLDLSSFSNFRSSFNGAPLPLRQLRGLYIYAKKLSPSNNNLSLDTLLNVFIVAEEHKNLSAEAFNDLMEIYATGFELKSDALNRKSFTGRRIEHLAICGYKTMGNHELTDTWRSVFESLHIYPSLQSGLWGKREDEVAFYELLGHVMSKKALWTQINSSPSNDRVGRLLPGPQIEQERTWFYVSSYFNDRQGCLNYFLKPACYNEQFNGKPLPLIMLFRSTASDREALSSFDSLLADLNPHGIGTYDVAIGLKEETKDLYRCTIPLWLGYVAFGDCDKAKKAFEEFFPKDSKSSSKTPPEEIIQQIHHCMHSLNPDNDKDHWGEFVNKVGKDKIDAFLAHPSTQEEWSKENTKVQQDVVFVGHSLGGALVQQFLVGFTVQDGRIPLKDCNYIAHCFCSPGRMDEDETAFQQFEKDHGDLLEILNQKWEINYRFEQEDLVPTGGKVWLGSTMTKDWLTLNAEIISPQFDTATCIDMVTIPTHGRRSGYATKDNDFKNILLTAADLKTLKEGYTMEYCLDLREKFGYPLAVPLSFYEESREAAGIAERNRLEKEKAEADLKDPQVGVATVGGVGEIEATAPFVEEVKEAALLNKIKALNPTGV
jgi:hypothetical protein